MTIGKRYQLFLHPAGAAAAVAAFLFLPSRTVLAAVLALLLHEVGHMAALWLCGVRAWRFELTPFGGMADAKSFEVLRPAKQAAAAGAGAAMSLLGALICRHCVFWHPFGYDFVRMQLSLAFVNCLPVWPLDGSRVMVALAACVGREEGMRRLLSYAGRACGLAFAVLGLWGAWKGMCNLSLLLAGPYLCYASGQGLLSERLRKLAYAQQKKLRNGETLPLTAYASRIETDDARLSRMLGRFSNERYHVLLLLNESGSIDRVMTEDEIYKQIFEHGKD